MNNYQTLLEQNLQRQNEMHYAQNEQFLQQMQSLMAQVSTPSGQFQPPVPTSGAHQPLAHMPQYSMEGYSGLGLQGPNLNPNRIDRANFD